MLVMAALAEFVRPMAWASTD